MNSNPKYEQLEEGTDECVLCLSDTIDPKRGDGLCEYCGAQADYYEEQTIEDELNLDS